MDLQFSKLADPHKELVRSLFAVGAGHIALSDSLTEKDLILCLEEALRISKETLKETEESMEDKYRGING